MKKLAMLFLAAFLMINLSSCGGKEHNKAQEATQTVKEKAEEMKEGVKEAASDVKDAAKDAAESVKETAKDAAEGVKEAASDVKEAVTGKDGSALFADNGCTACHKEAQKSIGPALKDIAAGYAGKEDQLMKFLKGESEAIIDPPQFAVMQPNLEITKKMADGDVKAIADYIMSFK